MAFATTDDLAARLPGVTLDLNQAEAFLEDATAYLQAEIGQLIEAGTTTYTTRHRGGGPLRLPQYPVRSITTVLLNGEEIDNYDFVDQELHFPPRWRADGFDDSPTPYVDVTVTFDYGYTTVPAELRSWCLALASQAIQAAAGGVLGAPRVRSEQIDDYSVTYVTDGSAMSLPSEVLERLRARYGAGAYVTGVGR